MRYGITWTTTHHSEVDLSVEQLAAWATTAAPGAFFAQSPEALAGTSAEQLVELISRNRHLRDRLLALYLQQTHPAHATTETHLTVVDVQPLDDVDAPSTKGNAHD
ncbi:hypothetical protein [Clavibacter michiganensis]|uniref:hypothetical protein n=1 Tax=Clavibacter michiganensis TaxID=28447 RepID=UPI0029302F66|nr:hypothetical protein [Clavibacter michiganensis]